MLVWAYGVIMTMTIGTLSLQRVCDGPRVSLADGPSWGLGSVSYILEGQAPGDIARSLVFEANREGYCPRVAFAPRAETAKPRPSASARGGVRDSSCPQSRVDPRPRSSPRLPRVPSDQPVVGRWLEPRGSARLGRCSIE